MRSDFMKKVFVPVIAAANSGAAPAWDKNYYVDATLGNDSNDGKSIDKPLKTIAAVAALAVNSGETVLWKCGETFAGALNIDNAGVTHDKYGTGALPIISNTTAGAVPLTISADNVTVKNLDVRGVAATAVNLLAGYVSGADGEGVKHCVVDSLTCSGPIYVFGQYNTIQNCTVNGTSNNGPAADSPGNGIWDFFAASHHNQFISNTVHNFTKRGFWSMNRTYNNLYQDNTIYSCGDGTNSFGIDLDGYGNVEWEHVVNGNTIYSINGDAIELENCWACTVNDNKVYSATVGIYAINYDTCVVGGASNEYGIAGDGRSLDTNNLLKNNLIYSCTRGIQLYDIGKVLMYYNTVSACTSSSFAMRDALQCPNIESINNLFAGPNDDGALAFKSALNGLAVDHHNLVYKASGSTYTYVETTGWTHKSLAQYITAYTPKGLNNVEADPVFVNAASDWHLQVSSPARGVGVTIGGISYDKDGVSRSNPPDIGCYQYVA